MALMLAKLYTALREAGVDDVKAREAAEEVALFENQLANVEAKSDDSEMDGWIQPRLDDRHRRHAVLRARQRTRRQRSSDRHGQRWEPR